MFLVETWHPGVALQPLSLCRGLSHGYQFLDLGYYYERSGRLVTPFHVSSLQASFTHPRGERRNRSERHH